MIIRPSCPSDRDELLRFIDEMGFNPRKARTWDGLGMFAMTAWEGDDLVGALPLESRTLQLAGGDSIATLHETAVAVRPEFRNKGIGTQLQQALFELRPGGAVLASVFREDPQSPAYRWYIRNGFLPAVHVESWFNDKPRSSEGVPEWDAWEHADPQIDWRAVDRHWEESMGQWGGVVSRRHRPLRQWLHVHPYLSCYQFHVLLARENESTIGHALLGVGALHSPTVRVDVLELCGMDENATTLILNCVNDFAARQGYHPVRWPLAKADPLTRVAQRSGMDPQWSFDMLVRPFDPSLQIATEAWRYTSADYA